MLFDMVMTGRVQEQARHMSRKFSRHRRRLLPILDLSHERKVLNYASKAEMANSASATVMATIQEASEVKDGLAMQHIQRCMASNRPRIG